MKNISIGSAKHINFRTKLDESAKHLRFLKKTLSGSVKHLHFRTKNLMNLLKFVGFDGNSCSFDHDLNHLRNFSCNSGKTKVAISVNKSHSYQQNSKNVP